MNSTLMILWKTLHFGHTSAHMYKVCACAWTHANTNLRGESVVQTPANIFIQNCFMAHGSVCVCVYSIYTHTCICALQKLGVIQDKENPCEWKIFTIKDHFQWHSVILQKHGLGFVFPLVYINLWIFSFYFYSVKTLKIFIQMGELGFFL